MKSQQLDKLRTDCNSCAYYKHSDCSLGRLQKFRNRGEVIDGDTPVIDRLCNISRKIGQESNTPRQDVMCKFGVVIFDFYMDETALYQTINSLFEVNYNINKFKIVIASCNTSGAYHLFDSVNRLKSKYKSELLLSLNNQIVEKDVYAKCLGATHFCKMESGDEIDPDIFTKVDNLLNDDLEKLLLFEAEGIKIIEFNTINNYYLESDGFDDIFNKLKTTENKYYRYIK